MLIRLPMILLVLFPLFSLAASSAQDSPQDLKCALQQAREHLITTPEFSPEHLLKDPVPRGTIEAWVRELRPDGTWADIDYADQSRGHWRLRTHLERMRDLARAWAAPGGELHGNPAVRDAALRACAHWIERDYRNPNWWHNEIGTPRGLAEFLVIMKDELPEETIFAGLAIVARAEIGMTGQNRIWKSGIVLLRAMLENDPQLARTARDAIAEQLKVSAGEGIQSDFSFHQHGPQLQFGNYGLGFAIDLVKWTRILSGTSYAIDPDALGTLRGFLLNGQSEVIWRGTMDINACARQLFPEAPARKAAALGVLLAGMAAADPGHAGEYAAAAARCQASTLPGTAANRMFWRSDYMVHREPAYMASVRMCSRRVIGAESGNDENLKGYHLGDGAHYIYRSGREYDDIFPVWDWRKLPGITARQSADPLPRLTWEGYRIGTGFAGGVSDGSIGAAALDFSRDGVRARKSWFFLHGKIVVLGAGISSEVDGHVTTTVNQCLLNGRITAGSDKSTAVIESRTRRLTGLRWLHHDGIGYVFPAVSRLLVSGAPQKGAWTDIFRAGPTDALQRDVFLLAFDHGSKPSEEGYACIMLPGATAAETAGFVANPDVDILRNSPGCQAVRSDRVVMAAFFQADRIGIAPETSLAVDRPCLVLMDTKTGRLTVSDPTQLESSLSIICNGKAVSIALPRGPDAGRSVTVVP